MATTRRKRKPEARTYLGLQPETAQEIIGIILMLLGAGILLAVFSLNRNEELTGPLGQTVAQFVRFGFGKAVAWLMPLWFIGLGATFFRKMKIAHSYAFAFGSLLLLFSLCGLLAQSGSHWGQTEQSALEWGGVLGGFLLNNNAWGLADIFGSAGTFLLLGGGCAISMLMISNTILGPALSRVWQELRRRIAAALKWPFTINLPQFRQPTPLRCFGPSDDDRVALLDEPAPQNLQLPDPNDDVIDLDARDIEIQGAAEDNINEVDTAEQEAEDDTFENEPVAPVPASRAPKAAPIQPPIQMVQEELDMFQTYELPEMSILADPPASEERMTNKELMSLSDDIERALNEFSIEARVVRVTQGPTVTLFELQMAPGVMVSRISRLENDIAMTLKATSIRILAPVPGRGTVGIEVPNSKPSVVYLKEILESERFKKIDKPLAFALGKTVAGEPMVCDLAKMPHLLIAGATGAGKSVCLNSIICSLLFTQRPDRIKFLMVDPKRVELNVYQELPHLLAPVVYEPKKAVAALTWMVGEMESRYERLQQAGERNIDNYNKVVNGHKQLHSLAISRQENIQLNYMPHIIVVIDELADLMQICKKDIEDLIARLAQMSRAVGIHLILATQRPSVNVITGIIKANFPTRIAFQVASQVDSKTIMDGKGAESLLGQGDMLFAGGNQRKPLRVQGTFVSDAEVEKLTNFIRGQECVQYIAEDFQTAEEIEADQNAPGAFDNDPYGYDPEQNSMESIAASISDEELGAAPLSKPAIPSSRPAAQRAAERQDVMRREQIAQERVLAAPIADDAEVAPSPQPVRTTHYMVEDFEIPEESEEELEDDLYMDALRLVLTHKKASVSLIQRKLKIGYARAGRLMDIMESKGIVGPYCGSKPREMLVDAEACLDRLNA
ncbi:hypothetical protein JXA32_12110 [Candidatus Sumerlaeota bacterium]|nr:hypothetical protein [Candidatus Sumerlaeota bacterium]